SLLTLLWLPISARRRRLDDDRFAGVDHGGVRAFQPLHRAVVAANPVLADLAILATGHAERFDAAVPGQDGVFHFFQEPHGAAEAVAGVPLAFAARAFADVEVFQHHRIAELQNLRIGQPRVGHVGVHGVGAREARAGRRARADRLVILVRVVAEVDVVHGALGAGHG